MYLFPLSFNLPYLLVVISYISHNAFGKNLGHKRTFFTHYSKAQMCPHRNLWLSRTLHFMKKRKKSIFLIANTLNIGQSYSRSGSSSNSWCRRRFLHSHVHNLCDSNRWLSPDLDSSEDLCGAQWDRCRLLYTQGRTRALTGHARMPNNRGWVMVSPHLLRPCASSKGLKKWPWA